MVSQQPQSIGQAIPIRESLKASSLFPLIFVAQMFILITGQQLFSITREVAILYMILPWGFLGFYFMRGRIKFSDLEDMTYKQDPIKRFIKGKKYGIKTRSVELQIFYFMIFLFGALTVTMALSFYGLIETDFVPRTERLSVIAVTIIFVAPSETLAFHSILPFVMENSKIMKQVRNKNLRYIYRTMITQGLFAVFHVGAFIDSPQFWGLMITTFFIGSVVLLPIADKFGFSPTAGVHAGWNIIILGCFAPLGG
jgi:hypothetical protein